MKTVKQLVREAFVDAGTVYKNVQVNDWYPEFKLRNPEVEEGKDAIEFKDWCDSGKAWFFDNNEEHTHTTEELYQLFKNNQQ